MARVGKFIDLSKCIGCRGCQVACKQWNQLPAQIEGFNGSYQTHADTLPKTYTVVQMIEVEEQGRLEWHFRKHQCMHCAEPTCVRVCPHKARKQTAEGVVYRVGDCEGCSYCAQKCPFGVPKIDATAKKSYNCWMCYDRIGNNLQPACAKTCPTGAISFGNRDDLVAKAQGRLAEVQIKYPQANLYGMNFLGGTGVFYLLLRDPGFYRLPANPVVPADTTWYGSANGTPPCYQCHGEKGGANVTFPAEGQIVAGIITVTAYADAKQAITKVDFYVDGQLKVTDTAAPYSFSLDTTKYTDGVHTIKAVSYTSGGSGENKTTTFYIKNTGVGTPTPPPAPAPVDSTAPTVTITSPKSGAKVRGSITVKVSASDSVGVTKVELYAKEVLYSSVNSAPFDFSLDTTKFANGILTLKAVAYDLAGNQSSTQLNIKISN